MISYWLGGLSELNYIIFFLEELFRKYAYSIYDLDTYLLTAFFVRTPEALTLKMTSEIVVLRTDKADGSRRLCQTADNYLLAVVSSVYRLICRRTRGLNYIFTGQLFIQLIGIKVDEYMDGDFIFLMNLCIRPICMAQMASSVITNVGILGFGFPLITVFHFSWRRDSSIRLLMGSTPLSVEQFRKESTCKL